MHLGEICENNACEIISCNLRHHRTCKFFLEFIIQLFEKVRTLEEKIHSGNDTINDEVDSDIETNKIFFNPHVGFPCEMFNCIEKSKEGLQVHQKAKHQNEMEISTQLNSPLELKVEKETVVDTEIEQHFISDDCDFVSEK